MQSALDYMIMTFIDDNLVEDLQTSIPEEDITRANIVRAGPLQADPTVPKVSVMSYPNDRADPEGWVHEVVPGGTPNQATKDPPSYQIGGGEMWYRHFTVEISMFFPPTIQGREESLNLATIVLARAERTLQLLNMGLGPDDFGHLAVDLRVMKSNLQVGGGPDGPTLKVYRGKIWYRVLTEKEGH